VTPSPSGEGFIAVYITLIQIQKFPPKKGFRAEAFL
jgi:hypothetical protein